jgi:cytochrome c biogenesis protein ResB
MSPKHKFVKSLKSIFSQIFFFFTNIWLLVVLLLFLMFFLIVGSFLPMDLITAAETNSFYAFLVKLGFGDFFHSAVFAGLLVLMWLNLTACTIKRMLKLPVTWYYVGTHLGHVGLVLVLLGGFISQFWGWKQEEVFFMHQTKSITKGGIELRANDFQIETFPDGAIKAFIGDVSVLEKGQERIRKKILVNQPLVYKGMYIYQAAYGNAWDYFDRLDLSIVARGTGKVIAHVKNIPFQKKVFIPALGQFIEIDAFYSDFRFDGDSGKPSNASFQHNNPVFHANFYKNGQVVLKQYILSKFPELRMSQSPYDLLVDHYESPRFTGLLIKKDPGMLTVWLGFVVLVTGLAISCYFPRKTYKMKSVRDPQE